MSFKNPDKLKKKKSTVKKVISIPSDAAIAVPAINPQKEIIKPIKNGYTERGSHPMGDKNPNKPKKKKKIVEKAAVQPAAEADVAVLKELKRNNKK
jgi:hypothetical protein